MSDSMSELGSAVVVVLALIVGIVVGSCATQSYKRDEMCRERLTNHAPTARDTVAIYREQPECNLKEPAK